MSKVKRWDSDREGEMYEIEGGPYVLAVDHYDLAARLAAENERLRGALQKIMALLADLLDNDYFNNIEAIVHGAGVPYPDAALAKGGGHE